jgi:hypothetical protein
LKTWFSTLVILSLLISAVPPAASAQSNLRWLPDGNERWMFQNYQAQLQQGGLVLDSNWNRGIVPAFAVLPLYSSERNVPPLSARQIDALHEENVRVVCSIVAGYWDRTAPDADLFTPPMVGRPVWGDMNRRWLDVRNTGVRDLMAARIGYAASIGCDAVDVSYLELWYQNTGFFITYGDQLAFNRFLADTAHANGLAVSLHNTTQQIPDLVGWFDFAIVEGCLETGDCLLYTPFLELGKPVFHVEYIGMTQEMHVCNAGRDLGFNSIIKDRAEDTRARAC